MKKIGVFLLLGLLFVSFASCADSSDISGKLREDVEGLEEGVGKVEEFTEKEKWEYLGERWKDMLLKNKYDFMAYKNSDGGIVVIEKESGTILPINSERKFDSVDKNLGNLNNLRRESIMYMHMIKERKYPGSPGFLHNIRSGYPDIGIFDEAGKIKHLANTGNDGPELIGNKIKKLCDDGFEFTDEVKFSRDKEAIKMTKGNLKDLEIGLGGSPNEGGYFVTGDEKEGFIKILVNGKESTIKFIPELEGIR